MSSGSLRNLPCWCGSGKKYKKCHLNRDKQAPANFFEAADRQRKIFRRKDCLHPSAPKECKGGIVRAHSVRRKADLSSIARNGHVYQGRADPSVLMKSGGKPKSVLIGINEASTFLGFCGHHDGVTFAPLETRKFESSDEQCFLLAYRNLAREFYVKRAQHASTDIWRDSDRGQPLGTQVAKQRVITIMQQAMKESLSNLEYHKSLYDAQ
jgi:hypothetical protein